MYKASAFSPGHITGFFEMCDSSPDPLYKGSRGAGVSLSIGVHTYLTALESESMSKSIYFGNIRTDEAGVSEKTIDIFLRTLGIRKRYRFEVRHTIAVPFGSGFGSSGAGALSLAITLNAALDTRLSENEVAQIAHIAEIESKTGLGTVVAEAAGGAEIRIEAGAPGISKIVHIPIERKYKIVTLTFGPLSTKKYIETPSVRDSINKFGGALVTRLHQKPTIPYFLELSREFAENTGLLPCDIINILSVLDRHVIQASMPMFGHGVFTIVPEERECEVTDIFTEFRHNGVLLVSDIDTKGAHAIDEAHDSG